MNNKLTKGRIIDAGGLRAGIIELLSEGGGGGEDTDKRKEGRKEELIEETGKNRKWKRLLPPSFSSREEGETGWQFADPINSISLLIYLDVYYLRV